MNPRFLASNYGTDGALRSSRLRATLPNTGCARFMASMTLQQDEPIGDAALLRAGASRVFSFVRDWARDWGGLLTIALTVYVVLFVLWLFVRWPAWEHATLIDNLGYLPVGLGAAVVALRAGLRRGLDSRTRRAWTIAGFAFLAWWAGDLLWLYYESIAGSAPFPSLADAGYLAFYPLLFLALLTFPSAPRLGQQMLKFWLDSLTVLLGGGLVVWYLVLRPIAMAEDSTALITTLSLAYPVGDLVLLFGIAHLVLRNPLARSSRPLAILAAVAALFVVADVAFGYLSIQEQYSTGDWPDAVWIVGLLFLAIAGQYQCWLARNEPLPEPSQGEKTRGFSLLPAGAVVLGFGMLLVSARGNVDSSLGGLITGAVVLTALVLIRQITSLSENTRLLHRSTLLADDLSHSEARFRSLVQNASDVIIVVDAAGVITYESPAVKRVLGYNPEDRIGTNALALAHPDDVSGTREILSLVRDQPGHFPTVEFRVRHADGGWRWLEVTATNLLDDPSVMGIVGNYRDVTERKALEEQLAHQATHDSLTNLANRTLFRNRLEHALARAQRHHEQVSIIFLDLDDFKTINDTLGHSAGDQVLIAVAERLVQRVRDCDLAARLGGDEFAVLLENAGREAAEVSAERILGVLRRPFKLKGAEVSVRASVGIAVRADHNDSPEELLRKADIAMYAAKGGGKARYAVYESELDWVGTAGGVPAITQAQRE